MKTLIEQAKELGHEYQRLECSYETFGRLLKELGSGLVLRPSDPAGHVIELRLSDHWSDNSTDHLVLIGPVLRSDDGFWPRGRRATRFEKVI